MLALARAPLPPPERDGPGASEQDPEHWWQAVVRVLAELSAELLDCRPRALALDGTSATLLLADAAGRPLGPALMYDDSRARDRLEAIQSVAPPEVPVHSASSSLAKLLHLLDACAPLPPGSRALHQADWILGRLSGHFGLSDENNCLKLGYDPRARRWPDWLGRLPLPPSCLPEVLVPGQPAGALTAEAARLTGLPEGLELRAGSTDSTAAALAAGVSQPGDAVTALGSTLVLKLVSERPVNAPEFGVYSHRFGQRWLVGGASNAGGAVCARYFSPKRMGELSLRLDPMQDSGLDYYPLLKPGERFPVNDPDYPPRLTPRPTDDLRFLHGLLEGLARIEARGYALLAELGAPAPRQVLSTGGGAVNPAWRAMRERLLGVPVRLAAHQEAAYGSALLARNRGFGD